MDLSDHEEEEEEEEIPMPMATTTYLGPHNQTHPAHTLIHDNHPLHPQPPNGPLHPLLSTPITENYHHHHHNTTPPNKELVVVKYRECLKNHAASIGGNATDGCGEFMPSGEDGTIESLKCSACSCHRNFHRKEPDGGDQASSCDYCYYYKAKGQKGLLISGGPQAYGLFPRAAAAAAHHHMVMPLGAIHASESDEMEGGGVVAKGHVVGKKRFRTKFTPEQKEKMLSFAERAGWRLQRQEEGLVQEFCQEIGVKRRVLKVWMHNNKHNYLPKKSPPLQLQ